MPLLGVTGAYLLPSHDLWQLIVWPTLIVVVSLTVLAQVVGRIVRALAGRGVASVIAAVALSVMASIALKASIAAAGYDWRLLMPTGYAATGANYWVKAVPFFAVLTLLLIRRGAIAKAFRLLSALGFAFAALAVFRMTVLTVNATPAPDPHSTQVTARTALSGAGAQADTQGRRVVWILFDETDFDHVFPPPQDSGAASPYPHFDELAHMSVFATHANSPASATLYSVPALLTGRHLGGAGIYITKAGHLMIDQGGGNLFRFGEAGSIFGALNDSGRQASLLGFYHPYCKLFQLARCDSSAWPEAGGLSGAFWPNVPDRIALKYHPGRDWDGIIRSSLALLPEFLRRDDALTFIHLNFPHPPSDFADRRLGLKHSNDPLVEYAHNLQFTDQVLGKILDVLRSEEPRHQTLLVVSTDHGLRNQWYRPNERDVSRPVTFFAWRVGDPAGKVVSTPVSTVNTSAMILAYLNGEISSQADIAEWWQHREFFPTYIAPPP